MPFTSDNTIRDRIKLRIQSAPVDAVIQTRWTLGGIENSASWPGELSSEADGGKAHGYVITRRRTKPRVVGNNKARIFEYNLFVMHYILPGDDALNSEQTIFNPELDRVAEAFDLATTEDLGARVVESMDFTIDSDRFGNELYHVAFGVLILEPCRI